MQNACMKTITIRDVPEETHAELVNRASAAGQSLQEYLKATLIEKASKPDMKTLLERIEKRVQANPNKLTLEKILEYKDADKR